MTSPKTIHCQHSPATKNKLIGAVIGGLKVGTVATHFGVPDSTARDIVEKFEKTGTTENLLRSGHPTKLNDGDKCQIVWTAQKQWRTAFAEISNQLGLDVCGMTIQRVLSNAGYHRCIARKVPFLTKRHRHTRMSWVRLYPHPPATTTVAAAPRKCPHGPSDGMLIVNAHTCPLHCVTGAHHHLLTSPHVCPSPRRGMWAHDMPRHRPNPPPPCSLPTATPNCHVTGESARVRHVTTVDNPQPPPHHPKLACTPGHGRWRPPPATSSPQTSMYATSWTMTTPTRYVTANNQHAHHVTTANDANKSQRPPKSMGWSEENKTREQQTGARRSREDGERGWGGKGRGMRRQGNGGQRRGLYKLPPSLFFIPEANEVAQKTMRRLVWAWLFPLAFGGNSSPAVLMMGQWDTHPLLHFECFWQCRWRGQHEAAPISFLFKQWAVWNLHAASVYFLFKQWAVWNLHTTSVYFLYPPPHSGGISSLQHQQMEAVWNPHTASVSFCFERGCVNHCPQFFLFQTEAAWIPHTTPVSFCFDRAQRVGSRSPPLSLVSNGGGVNPTHWPWFLSFTPQ